MPEDMCTELNKALDHIDDTIFETPIVRNQNYKVIQNVLDSDVPLSVTDIERVLAVCVHSINDEKKFSGTSLTIISSILRRVKSGQWTTVPNLLPSALAIVDITKTASAMPKLAPMCFNTLLQYPDETLVEIAVSHTNKCMDLFNHYCHQKITEHRLMPCALLIRLLKSLPREKKTIFVKDNLKFWFVNLIPTIINSELNGLNSTLHFEALELLADELLNIEYCNNPHWDILFTCIFNPKKYPLVMKSLLDAGNPHWHRIWIVFIKLLKNMITRSNTQGSPINALLPVVESAFKMDVPNRCRAFQCWDVLIDNFSKETSEVYINKRLKLLIIPLHSNNAKVEETAIAKLNTWWHLIRQFQTKLDKFHDTVLMAFLNFCFGRNISTPKAMFVPGLISSKVKKLGVEAFINIAGHLDCPGCCSLPRLDGRFLNTQMLVCSWGTFAFCLRKAIIIAADESVGVTVNQAQCLWKSFVLTIGELPENNVRRDIFNELLSVLEKLAQDVDNCATDNDGKIKLADLILHLIFSLFTNENNKIISLLTTKQLSEGPMFTILTIILGPISSKLYYKNYSTSSLNKLKSVTNCILNEDMCSVTHIVDWLLKNLSPNDNTLAVWTALAQSVYENTPKTDLNLNTIILWPLQNIQKFGDVAMASMAWFNLYTLAFTNNSINDQEISQLTKSIAVVKENKDFMLNASLVILKFKLVKENGNDIEEDVQTMWNAMSKIDEYESIEKTLLVLVDTLILLTSKIADISNDTISEYSISTTIKILTLVKQQSPDTVKGLLQFIEQLHKNIEIVFKKTDSIQLKRKIISELTNYATASGEKKNKEIMDLLNLCLCEIKEADSSSYKTIQSTIDGVEPKIDLQSCPNTNKNTDKKDFTTPNTKVITRKAKKREANIVNTVVENGEEYVVVKSNWKFNPRKLTENQKEKMQRKREDIPALYQDLSQSQDEFKMATWKTDSQDTSTTNSSKSNSKTSEEPASILKLMPSSDVVPKIIENIFSESTPKIDVAKEKLANDNSSLAKQITQIANKDVKSPRVALKDRVFRNVRNLIEKSSLPSNGKDLSESLIQIENVPKTPLSTESSVAKIVNSAPPKVNVERPSRVKRKPRKFDDTELFGLKRRRNSSALSDSQTDIEMNHSQAGIQENNLQTEINTDIEIVTENDNLEIKTSSNGDIITDVVDSVKSDELKIADDNMNKSTNDIVVESIELKENNIQNIIPSQEVIEINTVEDNIIETKATEISELKVEDTSSKAPNKDMKPITPKSTKKKDSQGTSVKKSTTKKSRIEKELAIDMVEGHPFLKSQTEKRLTRKNLNSSANNSRRTSLVEKTNKTKTDVKTAVKPDKKKEKGKESGKEKTKEETKTEQQRQDSSFDSFDDAPCSEDIIESSQDSTVTTISVKSTKPVAKKVVVVLENVHLLKKRSSSISETQNLLESDTQLVLDENKEESKEDIEIPHNKTAEDVQKDVDLTETMDTEPFDSKIEDEIIVIPDDVPIISLDTDISVAGPETQALAEADTLPNTTDDFVELQTKTVSIDSNKTSFGNVLNETDLKNENKVQSETESKTDVTIAETLDVSSIDKDNDASSPFRNDVQRKQDFLDNTLEISPIKTMSPNRNEKTPSPETSSDYVLIKLSSPVQSNGEPFEKCDSPEIFTEEKVSPDKRDQSPTREEIIVTNTSPSSSLSLKKNRPQVRSGGRAAQMLGLCVPDRLHSLINSEKPDTEEPKRSPITTPARRNLRILYNTVGDNNENPEENEDSETFLKLKRTVPTANSSPSMPILKRKLSEITDDATISPVSKRKRVSFHDPPVSITMSVQKYIEPSGIRSPQNSVLKRQERQLRSQTNMKSQKRLDTAFKLDTVVNKAVGSFDDSEKNMSVDDTQVTSLDETPVAEVVKTSDLNDADPICPDLIHCTDSIDVIASELSSPATKIMFLKELEGKIVTIGDLAKMTELEVNRLCIKAPKVKIARQVLSDYASKKVVSEEKDDDKDISEVQEPIDQIVPEIIRVDAEVQANIERVDMETQTNIKPFESVDIQTDNTPTAHMDTQTIESGSNSSEYVIKSSLSDRPDFVEELNKNLPDASKLIIAESLSFDDLKSAFLKKLTNKNSSNIIRDVLEKTLPSDGTDLSRLQTYLCEEYKSRELVLFCSELLRKVHDKSNE